MIKLLLLNAPFALFVIGTLFLLMLLFLEIGRRWGKKRLALDPQGARVGVGGIEGAIFALMGLLIAFTFSGAASRFDMRRNLIVEEANNIGTAYLRLDLLPQEVAPEVKGLFRGYLSKRLEAYRKLPNIKVAFESLAESEKIQSVIWSQSVAGCSKNSNTACSILLLPALNSMFDIANTRKLAGEIHPPVVVFGMLSGLAIICCLMAGFAMAESKNRNWFHSLSFATILVLTIYVIIDLEYPRIGLIRVDTLDIALEQVLENMK